ncbi:MAG: peptidoglycan DD-metalloendopeptidase family protein [Mucilaginibacter sp.]
MNATERLSAWLQQHPQNISKVVDFNPATDKLYPLDLTANNRGLTAAILSDVNQFSEWVTQKLTDNNCRYGIGGYMELRTIYDNREQFATDGQERRNLHLGLDIWGNAGTPVYAPLSGKVHSFQDNNHFGDYGPTIILQHDLDGLMLYSLYGHLSRSNLSGLSIGQPVTDGQLIANLGDIHENGNWPPHLHFQLMLDMQGYQGDFPGACKLSEREKYMAIVVDPGVVLGM